MSAGYNAIFSRTFFFSIVVCVFKGKNVQEQFLFIFLENMVAYSVRRKLW